MQTIYWSDICPQGEQLHIASISTGRQSPPALHNHDFYECFLLLDGEGIHRLPGREEPLRATWIYFVGPEHVHAIAVKPGQNLHFLNLAFASRTFEMARSAMPEIGSLWVGEQIASRELDPETAKEIVDLSHEAAGGTMSGADALYLLSGIVRTLSILTNERTGADMPDWLRTALPLADQPDALREGLPALLKRCGRSKEHVSRVFRSVLGCTPTQWLTAARIRRAALLLQTTAMPILDICFECGFESPSYFHRLFREAHHQTPLQYRLRSHRVQAGGA